MEKRGSQTRQDIADTDLVFLRFAPGSEDRVLRDKVSQNFELWTPQDDFAGYVLVIDGIGHEFVRSLSESEVLEMM